MTDHKRCADTRHDFEKFDDATIYCRRCGEQRVVDVQAIIGKFSQPVYLPCPGPHYPAPTYPWWGSNTAPLPHPPYVITYANDTTIPQTVE
jgi:hypothetical protein